MEAALYLGHAYLTGNDFGRAAALLRRNVEAADRESWRPPRYKRGDPFPGVARTGLE